MQTIVIGGGSIGQLAGWVFPDATVLDWRRTPPDAERYRPRVYGAMYLHEALEGLPCREFWVHTTVDGRAATRDSIAQYKAKVGKQYDIEAGYGDQFEEFTIGWELTEFPRVEVMWGMAIDRIDLAKRTVHFANPVPGGFVSMTWDRIISTIPLYSLLEMCKIQPPTALAHKPIAVRTTPRPLDLPKQMAEISVNYVSDPSVAIYRTTDRNGSRDNEWLYEQHREVGAAHKIIRPGKIYPEAWTRPICDRLNAHGVYPVGRAGRWEPDELLHHSFKDLLRWATDARA